MEMKSCSRHCHGYRTKQGRYRAINTSCRHHHSCVHVEQQAMGIATTRNDLSSEEGMTDQYNSLVAGGPLGSTDNEAGLSDRTP